MMELLTGHVLWWSGCAVALFWAVGAYNRLVRLRSDALRAFATLGPLLHRFTDQVATAARLLAPLASAPPTLANADAAGPTPPSIALALTQWPGLEGAATQYAASLAAARARPLDAEGMAALGAASAVLRMAWQRLAEEYAALPSTTSEVPADAPSAQALLDQWDDLHREIDHGVQEFATAVLAYNGAVTQFPAVLLAWMFGFRKARALALPRS